MDTNLKTVDFSYTESAPDSENQVTITIIDSNNEKSEIRVERFSEDEMEFLNNRMNKLKEKQKNNANLI